MQHGIQRSKTRGLTGAVVQRGAALAARLAHATLRNVRFSAGYEGKANITRSLAFGLVILRGDQGRKFDQCIPGPTGSRTVKTDPLPASLATVTSPPIMRASLRVMASPSPVPPNFCAVAASAWVNSSNSLICCSAVMPIPVSETANSTKLLPLLTLRAASLTSPALVHRRRGDRVRRRKFTTLLGERS